MLIKRFQEKGLSHYSYAVGSKENGQIAIIDPHFDVEMYLEYAAQQGLVISHVLETHIHGDYVSGEIFNVGYENQTVRCLAETVRDAVGRDVKLSTVPTDDNRSYHISSEKIRRELGFSATHSVEEAVRDLLTAFDSGSLPNSLTDEKYFNIKRMQSLDLE